MLYDNVACHRVMSHDECGKVVHRPYSSCISSVQNLMKTLLSFFDQLGQSTIHSVPLRYQYNISISI